MVDKLTNTFYVIIFVFIILFIIKYSSYKKNTVIENLTSTKSQTPYRRNVPTTNRNFRTRTSPASTQAPTINRNFPTTGTQAPTINRNFPTTGTQAPTINRNFPTTGTQLTTNRNFQETGTRETTNRNFPTIESGVRRYNYSMEPPERKNVDTIPSRNILYDTPNALMTSQISEINSNEWITEHNRVRADVGQKPVIWNQNIANDATEYAKKCVFVVHLYRQVYMSCFPSQCCLNSFNNIILLILVFI